MKKGKFLIRLWAIVLGLACHTAFAWAVWGMFWGIANGFTNSEPHWIVSKFNLELLVDFALILQFPLTHSILLTRSGRKFLAAISIDKRLVTTSFALIASLQLGLGFKYWLPTEVILYTLPWELTDLCWALYGASWLFLGKTMLDAGLAYQTGALGWWSVFRDREPQYPGLRTEGSFKHVRQPIYLAFFLILWTSPSGSLDRIVLAVFWGIYLLIAPLLKEKRFAEYFGERFAGYKSVTPYFIPRLKIFARDRMVKVSVADRVRREDQTGTS
jgi:protein-S-isoprenylcysteine O-methyltransferase Ste14